MARLLNSLINRYLYYAIVGYRKLISKYTGRDCIYPVTCSQFALDLLNDNSKSVVHSLKVIFKRIKGCKVLRIVKDSPTEWHAINGVGETLYTDSLNDRMKSNIENILNRK